MWMKKVQRFAKDNNLRVGLFLYYYSSVLFVGNKFGPRPERLKCSGSKPFLIGMRGDVVEWVL
jgi:hypothetical protein